MSSSSILWKGFNLFFSKLKCFPTVTLPPPTNISDEQQTNFSKSLTFSSSTGAGAAECFFSSDEEDDHNSDADDSIPDFASAVASHRFFCSSPGNSNSILEPSPPAAVVPGGVAVQTYSPDPYSDFRESMVEMIQSRDLESGGTNWEFLHELLSCYLTLNPKHTHKFIVAAFADVILSLTSLSPPDDGCRKHYVQLL